MPNIGHEGIGTQRAPQVVNRHFTVGMRIPSIYLKLLSDGTVECHAIKFGKHDEDATKTTHLTPSELAQITSVLNDAWAAELSHRYALQRTVFDSWMEWDITIDLPPVPPRNVTLAFAGGSRDSQPPDALRKLDCQILELRRRVYGDKETYYTPACRAF